MTEHAACRYRVRSSGKRRGHLRPRGSVRGPRACGKVRCGRPAPNMGKRRWCRVARGVVGVVPGRGASDETFSSDAVGHREF